MEGACRAMTLHGTPCKNKVVMGHETCWIHSCTQCSLCLGVINDRAKRTLPCNHEFHERCIERWKRACPTDIPTCPMCRHPFDVPLYRCLLRIERVSDSNVTNQTFQTSNVNDIVSGFGYDFRELIPNQPGRWMTELHFDIEQGEDLGQVLDQLGVPRNNIDEN